MEAPLLAGTFKTKEIQQQTDEDLKCITILNQILNSLAANG